MRKLILAILSIAFSTIVFCQSVSISNDGSAPSISAMLDIKNANKGLLIPRVALLNTNDATTIAAPAISLLIYNTATNGVGNVSVTPGYYYWNGTLWLKLSTGSSSSSVSSWLLTGNAGTDTSLNFLGTSDNKPLLIKVNNSKSGYIGAEAHDGNVFWGYQSGNNNKGYSNVAVGIKALFSNTTISNLVAIGDSTLFSNSTGTYNTAVGSKTLYSNTTGMRNTAVGFVALYSNTVGIANTATGQGALTLNTTGGLNTAIGYDALFSNMTGSNNTAIGQEALGNNASGNFNTSVGGGALQNNTTGSSNTAIGDHSLSANKTGNQNVAIGENALSGSTGSFFNTAVGGAALSSNNSGSFNTAIGFSADVTVVNLSNATAIGYGAVVNASNKVRIGNTNVNVIEGQVAYSFPSDARFKYNIQSNVPGLDFITRLTPITYYFNEDKLAQYTKTGHINDDVKLAVYTETKQLHTGFLAQDVEKITKQLGYNFDGIHAPVNDRDHYSLAYTQFIMPLVKSVQEQQAIINNQAKEIKEMKEQIAILLQVVNKL